MLVIGGCMDGKELALPVGIDRKEYLRFKGGETVADNELPSYADVSQVVAKDVYIRMRVIPGDDYEVMAIDGMSQFVVLGYVVQDLLKHVRSLKEDLVFSRQTHRRRVDSL